VELALSLTLLLVASYTSIFDDPGRTPSDREVSHRGSRALFLRHLKFPRQGQKVVSLIEFFPFSGVFRLKQVRSPLLCPLLGLTGGFA